MADSYHIIDGQVVPFHGGRKDTNTGAWRDATPLELQLQEQLAAAEEALAEAAAALEAARGDSARLAWLAIDGCVEGFVGVEYDIYDYACGVAEESGREEPNGSDMLGGLRRLVDAAIDAAREARNG